MAAPTPSAVLTWGIVTLPIKIYPAARNAATDLVNLHRSCAEKSTEASLGMLKRCKGCLSEVPNEQIVKGWKKSDGTYLLFTTEEIASLQAERSKGMTITGFVDFSAVDPIWLGPSNFIGPLDKSTLRPFLLLYESLKQENLAAIVSYYGHGRDRRGVIRAASETLVLFDSFFPSELRTYSGQAKVELTTTEFSSQERALGKQLIDSLRCDFTQMWMQDLPGDTFLDRVEQLKEARDKGLPMPELPATPQVDTGADLMALLQGSITSIKNRRTINVDATPVTPSKPPVKIEAEESVARKRKKA